MNNMKEYWINVYLNPFTNKPHLGVKWIDKSHYINNSKWDDWFPIYRIHVKMKPKKTLMKIFNVEIPGVYAGDGMLKDNKFEIIRDSGFKNN